VVVALAAATTLLMAAVLLSITPFAYAAAGFALAPVIHGRTTSRDCNLNGVIPETEEASVTVVAMDVSAEPGEGLDEPLVRQLAARARTEGLKLTGQGGLLGRLTNIVVEFALEGEMDGHLGHGKQDPTGRDGGNSRNRTRCKTLVTEAGPVEVEVPRDRELSLSR
jgi:hypothetical protein